MHKRTIIYCGECEKEFDVQPEICPHCESDWFQTRDYYNCPYCDVEMDNENIDWDGGFMCPNCDWYTEQPDDTIPFVEECLKKYDERKAKEAQIVAD